MNEVFDDETHITLTMPDTTLARFYDRTDRLSDKWIAILKLALQYAFKMFPTELSVCLYIV